MTISQLEIKMYRVILIVSVCIAVVSLKNTDITVNKKGDPGRSFRSTSTSPIDSPIHHEETYASTIRSKRSMAPVIPFKDSEQIEDFQSNRPRPKTKRCKPCQCYINDPSVSLKLKREEERERMDDSRRFTNDPENTTNVLFRMARKYDNEDDNENSIENEEKFQLRPATLKTPKTLLKSSCTLTSTRKDDPCDHEEINRDNTVLKRIKTHLSPENYNVLTLVGKKGGSPCRRHRPKYVCYCREAGCKNRNCERVILETYPVWRKARPVFIERKIAPPGVVGNRQPSGVPTCDTSGALAVQQAQQHIAGMSRVPLIAGYAPGNGLTKTNYDIRTPKIKNMPVAQKPPRPLSQASIATLQIPSVSSYHPRVTSNNLPTVVNPEQFAGPNYPYQTLDQYRQDSEPCVYKIPSNAIPSTKSIDEQPVLAQHGNEVSKGDELPADRAISVGHGSPVDRKLDRPLMEKESQYTEECIRMFGRVYCAIASTTTSPKKEIIGRERQGSEGTVFRKPEEVLSYYVLTEDYDDGDFDGSTEYSSSEDRREGHEIQSSEELTVTSKYLEDDDTFKTVAEPHSNERYPEESNDLQNSVKVGNDHETVGYDTQTHHNDGTTPSPFLRGDIRSSERNYGIPEYPESEESYEEETVHSGPDYSEYSAGSIEHSTNQFNLEEKPYRSSMEYEETHGTSSTIQIPLRSQYTYEPYSTTYDKITGSTQTPYEPRKPYEKLYGISYEDVTNTPFYSTVYIPSGSRSKYKTNIIGDTKNSIEESFENKPYESQEYHEEVQGTFDEDTTGTHPYTATYIPLKFQNEDGPESSLEGTENYSRQPHDYSFDGHDTLNPYFSLFHTNQNFRNYPRYEYPTSYRTTDRSYHPELASSPLIPTQKEKQYPSSKVNRPEGDMKTSSRLSKMQTTDGFETTYTTIRASLANIGSEEKQSEESEEQLESPEGSDEKVHQPLRGREEFQNTESEEESEEFSTPKQDYSGTDQFMSHPQYYETQTTKGLGAIQRTTHTTSVSIESKETETEESNKQVKSRYEPSKTFYHSPDKERERIRPPTSSQFKESTRAPPEEPVTKWKDESGTISTASDGHDYYAGIKEVTNSYFTSNAYEYVDDETDKYPGYTGSGSTIYEDLQSSSVEKEDTMEPSQPSPKGFNNDNKRKGPSDWTTQEIPTRRTDLKNDHVETPLQDDDDDDEENEDDRTYEQESSTISNEDVEMDERLIGTTKRVQNDMSSSSESEEEDESKELNNPEETELPWYGSKDVPEDRLRGTNSSVLEQKSEEDFPSEAKSDQVEIIPSTKKPVKNIEPETIGGKNDFSTENTSSLSTEIYYPTNSKETVSRKVAMEHLTKKPKNVEPDNFGDENDSFSEDSRTLSDHTKVSEIIEESYVTTSLEYSTTSFNTSKSKENAFKGIPSSEEFSTELTDASSSTTEEGILSSKKSGTEGMPESEEDEESHIVRDEYETSTEPLSTNTSSSEESEERMESDIIEDGRTKSVELIDKSSLSSEKGEEHMESDTTGDKHASSIESPDKGTSNSEEKSFDSSFESREITESHNVIGDEYKISTEPLDTNILSSEESKETTKSDMIGDEYLMSTESLITSSSDDSEERTNSNIIGDEMSTESSGTSNLSSEGSEESMKSGIMGDEYLTSTESLITSSSDESEERTNSNIIGDEMSTESSVTSNLSSEGSEESTKSGMMRDKFTSIQPFDKDTSNSEGRSSENSLGSEESTESRNIVEDEYEISTKPLSIRISSLEEREESTKSGMIGDEHLTSSESLSKSSSNLEESKESTESNMTGDEHATSIKPMDRISSSSEKESADKSLESDENIESHNIVEDEYETSTEESNTNTSSSEESEESTESNIMGDEYATSIVPKDRTPLLSSEEGSANKSLESEESIESHNIVGDEYETSTEVSDTNTWSLEESEESTKSDISEDKYATSIEPFDKDSLSSEEKGPKDFSGSEESTKSHLILDEYISSTDFTSTSYVEESISSNSIENKEEIESRTVGDTHATSTELMDTSSSSSEEGDSQDLSETEESTGSHRVGDEYETSAEPSSTNTSSLEESKEITKSNMIGNEHSVSTESSDTDISSLEESGENTKFGMISDEHVTSIEPSNIDTLSSEDRSPQDFSESKESTESHLTLGEYVSSTDFTSSSYVVESISSDLMESEESIESESVAEMHATSTGPLDTNNSISEEGDSKEFSESEDSTESHLIRDEHISSIGPLHESTSSTEEADMSDLSGSEENTESRFIEHEYDTSTVLPNTGTSSSDESVSNELTSSDEASKIPYSSIDMISSTETTKSRLIGDERVTSTKPLYTNVSNSKETDSSNISRSEESTKSRIVGDKYTSSTELPNTDTLNSQENNSSDSTTQEEFVTTTENPDGVISSSKSAKSRLIGDKYKPSTDLTGAPSSEGSLSVDSTESEEKTVSPTLGDKHTTSSKLFDMTTSGVKKSISSDSTGIEEGTESNIVEKENVTSSEAWGTPTLISEESASSDPTGSEESTKSSIIQYKHVTVTELSDTNTSIWKKSDSARSEESMESDIIEEEHVTSTELSDTTRSDLKENISNDSTESEEGTESDIIEEKQVTHVELEDAETSNSEESTSNYLSESEEDTEFSTVEEEQVTSIEPWDANTSVTEESDSTRSEDTESHSVKEKYVTSTEISDMNTSNLEKKNSNELSENTEYTKPHTIGGTQVPYTELSNNIPFNSEESTSNDSTESAESTESGIIEDRHITPTDFSDTTISISNENTSSDSIGSEVSTESGIVEDGHITPTEFSDTTISISDENTSSDSIESEERMKSGIVEDKHKTSTALSDTTISISDKNISSDSTGIGKNTKFDIVEDRRITPTAFSDTTISISGENILSYSTRSEESTESGIDKDGHITPTQFSDTTTSISNENILNGSTESEESMESVIVEDRHNTSPQFSDMTTSISDENYSSDSIGSEERMQSGIVEDKHKTSTEFSDTATSISNKNTSSDSIESEESTESGIVEDGHITPTKFSDMTASILDENISSDSMGSEESTESGIVEDGHVTPTQFSYMTTSISDENISSNSTGSGESTESGIVEDKHITPTEFSETSISISDENTSRDSTESEEITESVIIEDRHVRPTKFSDTNISISDESTSRDSTGSGESTESGIVEDRHIIPTEFSNMTTSISDENISSDSTGSEESTESDIVEDGHITPTEFSETSISISDENTSKNSTESEEITESVIIEDRHVRPTKFSDTNISISDESTSRDSTESGESTKSGIVEDRHITPTEFSDMTTSISDEDISSDSTGSEESTESGIVEDRHITPTQFSYMTTSISDGNISNDSTGSEGSTESSTIEDKHIIPTEFSDMTTSISDENISSDSTGSGENIKSGIVEDTHITPTVFSDTTVSISDKNTSRASTGSEESTESGIAEYRHVTPIEFSDATVSISDENTSRASIGSEESTESRIVEDRHVTATEFSDTTSSVSDENIFRDSTRSEESTEPDIIKDEHSTLTELSNTITSSLEENISSDLSKRKESSKSGPVGDTRDSYANDLDINISSSTTSSTEIPKSQLLEDKNRPSTDSGEILSSTEMSTKTTDSLSSKYSTINKLQEKKVTTSKILQESSLQQFAKGTTQHGLQYKSETTKSKQKVETVSKTTIIKSTIPSLKSEKSTTTFVVEYPSTSSYPKSESSTGESDQKRNSISGIVEKSPVELSTKKSVKLESSTELSTIKPEKTVETMEPFFETSVIKSARPFDESGGPTTVTIEQYSNTSSSSILGKTSSKSIDGEDTTLGIGPSTEESIEENSSIEIKTLISSTSEENKSLRAEHIASKTPLYESTESESNSEESSHPSTEPSSSEEISSESIHPVAEKAPSTESLESTENINDSISSSTDTSLDKEESLRSMRPEVEKSTTESSELVESLSSEGKSSEPSVAMTKKTTPTESSEFETSSNESHYLSTESSSREIETSSLVVSVAKKTPYIDDSKTDTSSDESDHSSTESSLQEVEPLESSRSMAGEISSTESVEFETNSNESHHSSTESSSHEENSLESTSSMKAILHHQEKPSEESTLSSSRSSSEEEEEESFKSTQPIVKTGPYTSSDESEHSTTESSLQEVEPLESSRSTMAEEISSTESAEFETNSDELHHSSAESSSREEDFLESTSSMTAILHHQEKPSEESTLSSTRSSSEEEEEESFKSTQPIVKAGHYFGDESTEDYPSTATVLGGSSSTTERVITKSSKPLPADSRKLLNNTIKQVINNLTLGKPKDQPIQIDLPKKPNMVGSEREPLPQIDDIPFLKTVLSAPIVEDTLAHMVKNILSSINVPKPLAALTDDKIKQALRTVIADMKNSLPNDYPLVVEEHSFKGGEWVTEKVTLLPTVPIDQRKNISPLESLKKIVDRTVENTLTNVFGNSLLAAESVKQPGIKNILVETVKYALDKKKNPEIASIKDSEIREALNRAVLPFNTTPWTTTKENTGTSEYIESTLKMDKPTSRTSKYRTSSESSQYMKSTLKKNKSPSSTLKYHSGTETSEYTDPPLKMDKPTSSTSKYHTDTETSRYADSTLKMDEPTTSTSMYRTGTESSEYTKSTLKKDKSSSSTLKYDTETSEHTGSTLKVDEPTSSASKYHTDIGSTEYTDSTLKKEESSSETSKYYTDTNSNEDSTDSTSKDYTFLGNSNESTTIAHSSSINKSSEFSSTEESLKSEGSTWTSTEDETVAGQRSTSKTDSLQSLVEDSTSSDINSQDWTTSSEEILDGTLAVTSTYPDVNTEIDFEKNLGQFEFTTTKSREGVLKTIDTPENEDNTVDSLEKIPIKYYTPADRILEYMKKHIEGGDDSHPKDEKVAEYDGDRGSREEATVSVPENSSDSTSGSSYSSIKYPDKITEGVRTPNNQEDTSESNEAINNDEESQPTEKTTTKKGDLKSSIKTTISEEQMIGDSKEEITTKFYNYSDGRTRFSEGHHTETSSEKVSAPSKESITKIENVASAIESTTQDRIENISTSEDVNTETSSEKGPTSTERIAPGRKNLMSPITSQTHAGTTMYNQQEMMSTKSYNSMENVAPELNNEDDSQPSDKDVTFPNLSSTAVDTVGRKASTMALEGYDETESTIHSKGTTTKSNAYQSTKKIVRQNRPVEEKSTSHKNESEETSRDDEDTVTPPGPMTEKSPQTTPKIPPGYLGVTKPRKASTLDLDDIITTTAGPSTSEKSVNEDDNTKEEKVPQRIRERQKLIPIKTHEITTKTLEKTITKKTRYYGMHPSDESTVHSFETSSEDEESTPKSTASISTMTSYHEFRPDENENLARNRPTTEEIVSASEPSSEKLSEAFMYFGKVYPEKDNCSANNLDELQGSDLYYVGDGVKLPLVIKKLQDGSFGLLISEKICEQMIRKKCPCCVPREGSIVREVKDRCKDKHVKRDLTGFEKDDEPRRFGRWKRRSKDRNNHVTGATASSSLEKRDDGTKRSNKRSTEPESTVMSVDAFAAKYNLTLNLADDDSSMIMGMKEVPSNGHEIFTSHFSRKLKDDSKSSQVDRTEKVPEDEPSVSSTEMKEEVSKPFNEIIRTAVSDEEKDDDPVQKIISINDVPEEKRTEVLIATLENLIKTEQAEVYAIVDGQKTKLGSLNVEEGVNLPSDEEQDEEVTGYGYQINNPILKRIKFIKRLQKKKNPITGQHRYQTTTEDGVEKKMELLKTILYWLKDLLLNPIVT